MNGFNLPPGVSTSMLPGNTPEELKAEAAYDAIYDKFDEMSWSTMFVEDKEMLADWIYEQFGKAYNEGYQQGVSDEKEARLMEEAYDVNRV